MKILSLLLLAFTVVTASAQDHFWDEVSTSQGIPCSYSNVSGQTSGGDIGCWAWASCYNAAQLDVSWYQQWSCSSGNYVVAGGYSDFDTAFGWDFLWDTWRAYNAGVTAGGNAVVYTLQQGGLWLIRSFTGWDNQDCEGGSSYSGPYNYDC
jgi:hypothetical protein